MPDEGPVLILSNHESTLDPVLVGILFRRKLVYLAKKSLFKNPIFGGLIRSYDSIPIDRERGGLEGLRAILERLKLGQAVLIFPEGTRSRTGRLLPIKGGFLSVAKRSQATLLPVAVVGGHAILSMESKLPRRFPVAAQVGEPISFEQYASLPEEEVVRLVSQSIQDCWNKAHQMRAVSRVSS